MQLGSAANFSAHENPYRCWCHAHVHLCAAGENVILLDLRQDKYLAVPRHAARALAVAVPGWPMPVTELERWQPPSEQEVRRVVRCYLDAGVLTAIESEGKSAAPIPYMPPRDLVPLGFERDATTALSWKDAMNFIGAATRAAYRLRTTSLLAIAGGMAARKATARRCEAFDSQLAAELACTYRRLQTFAFTGRDRCLLQSLSFANFLSCYGLFPDWVFGVQTRPFAAHCWLQHGHYLLNETPDGVKRFIPIVSI